MSLASKLRQKWDVTVRPPERREGQPTLSPDFHMYTLLVVAKSTDMDRFDDAQTWMRDVVGARSLASGASPKTESEHCESCTCWSPGAWWVEGILTVPAPTLEHAVKATRVWIESLPQSERRPA